MFLTHHLPLLRLSFSLKPKTLTPLFSTTNPISHFSSSSPLFLSLPDQPQQDQQTQQENQQQTILSIDKLFVPPETAIEENNPSFRVLKGSNIVLSKYAVGAHVEVAEFVKSSVGFEECPGNGEPEFALVGRSNVGKSSLLNSLVRRKKLALTSKKPVYPLISLIAQFEECPGNGEPEFALVGRSNVGKSSLLNSLVRRKKLALTSKKPGKTQCINHFKINESWYLVDLPGYGYASAPHELRIDWDKFTKDYFLNRPTLVSVFLLIDASIPAKKIDLEYASWLGQNQIPMTLIFTKCDKRKKKKNGGKRPEENVQDFQDLISDFFQSVPPWIMTSSVTNQGRDEILLHMAQLRNYWLKH